VIILHQVVIILKGESSPHVDVRATAGMDYPIISGYRLKNEWKKNKL
jgi:hypothetical protein